ncbi:MAG TPA: hypothetical protein VGG19_07905 [Tepidisphaeraceae bacterium]|jgi:hypothetical protein
MPVDLIQQYASFKQRAKEQLKSAIAERSALDAQIAALESILGEIGSAKSSGAKASKMGAVRMTAASTGRRGKRGKKRSPDQLKQWAFDVVDAIKGSKNGAARKDIESTTGSKLPQAWQKAVERFSGHKLKMTGDKATAKYFIR